MILLENSGMARVCFTYALRKAYSMTFAQAAMTGNWGGA